MKLSGSMEWVLKRLAKPKHNLMTFRALLLAVALSFGLLGGGLLPNSKANFPQTDNPNLVIAGALADESDDRAAAIKRLVKIWSKTLEGSRYFEADHKCVDLNGYPGWKDITLRKCEYTKFDPKDHAQRNATVIAHEPKAEQIAKWIVDACYATGHKENRFMDRLFAHVICQSGGQFPVAGIVLEDEYDKPPHQKGVYENHCFRDGVTVKAGKTWVVADEGPLTDAKVKQCLEQDITGVFQFARVQSTTREDYKANGGTEDVGTFPKGLRWKDVTRELYQAALNHDRNELMVAWARSHLGQPASRKDDPCVCKFKATSKYCVP